MTIEIIDSSEPTERNPGIFRIECIPTKRTLFVKADQSIMIQADLFRKDLKAGVCPNQELLDDFKKYGNENFQFYTVVMGPSLANPTLLESEFNKCKSSWTGPQY